MDPVRIRYIKEEIEHLPKGNITYKTIKGKPYAYLQWTEDKKQKSRRVRDDELEALSEKIRTRKELERLIREAAAQEVPAYVLLSDVNRDEHYLSKVKTGQELLDFIEPVRAYEKRECYPELKAYVEGSSTDRVFILYGLRRTGKTTLIRQVIADLPLDMMVRSAYIQVTPDIDLAKMDSDLRGLKRQGYRYIFIDEVTMMDDFIEGAALFSDIYASCGMKIVLSGTDSLGFMLSQARELYDRCYMTHTTFVPYREFERVLGIKGINEYIRYGGTMSPGGVNYNSKPATFATFATFATEGSASDYVDSAIAHNIQHSLKNYQDGRHFRLLLDLYEADELTSAINRIVEDMNHRFTLEVLTKDFKSNDLGISARNLLKDRKNPSTILYQIDTAAVTDKLRKLLEIRNRPEMSVAITDAHRVQIKEYLDLLDITVDIDTVHLADLNRKDPRTVITQPGLRYAQAQALIRSLMQDDVFRAYSLSERNAIRDRILSDIQGRMMEDLILLETKMALPKCDIFKLVFAIGEFDMVVFDPEAASCKIYEIKHSKETALAQYRHLMDAEKCAATEFRYGPITEKTVIYRGRSLEIDGIHYVNAEEYLNGLGNGNVPSNQ